jgi:hypothetical protein
MRVPYTYTYLQQFIKRLQDAKLPGVKIVDLGATKEKRRVQIIQLEEVASTALDAAQPLAVGVATAPEKTKAATFAMIAREHATEHASSWAVHGALLDLIADTPHGKSLRKGMVYMLIPIQDPDGAANSQFERMTEKFSSANKKDNLPEIDLYTRHFKDHVDAGNPLDAVISLHNVESDDGDNIFSPFITSWQVGPTVQFNKGLLGSMKAVGYATHIGKPGEGVASNRLYGWLAHAFGTLGLVYEVNDRYPQKRLQLQELQGIGSVMVSYVSSWSRSGEGKGWRASRRSWLKKRIEEREIYYADRGEPTDEHARKFDLEFFGY